MKTIESRRLEFLEDTVRYYSEDVLRRAVSKTGKCQYKTEDGRKCAIGRHIIKDKDCEAFDMSKDNTVQEIIRKNPDCLPEHVKELGVVFLINIQKLHDSRLYWNDNGISQEGKQEIEVIKREHCTEQK